MLEAIREEPGADCMCLGVSVGPNTVKLIEVRRDTPAQEVRRIIEAHTPKALEQKPS
jgi:hypothetical protein